MPNPRYISRDGEPTVELLGKLHRAKNVYFSNLDEFCKSNFYDLGQMSKITGVFLIGSHAEERKWNNDTSDVDIKLVAPDALPMWLHHYKREVLDPNLCPLDLEKHRHTDLFFVRELYQVLEPRWDLTAYWNQLSLE